MGQTVTVTIGRNVGDEPLPAEAWNHFVARTRQAVSGVTDGELWAAGPSRGEWQGVAEESFVFYGPLPDGPTATALRTLRAQLANLATYYRQDAIGLSVGSAELVESYAASVTA